MLPAQIIIFSSIGILALTLVALWFVGERGQPLRPSTWRWIRAAGLRRFLRLGTAHGYLYKRWMNQYIYAVRYWILPRLPE